MEAGDSSGLSKLASTLGAEVSSRSLALLRIFGALSIWTEFASPWVAHRMDDLVGTWLLAWGVFIGAWLTIFGFKTRYASALMALCFAGLHLYYGPQYEIEKLVYPVREFQLVVLLALTPCGRSLSIDRVLETRRARREGRSPPPETIPWWVLELFVLHSCTVFFWFAVSTYQAGGLEGTAFEVHLFGLYGTADTYVAHPNFSAFVGAVAYSLTILNFVFAFGLLFRRLRPYLVFPAAAYLYVAMMAFSRNYASSYEYLIAIVFLIACIPPHWIDELVGRQLARKSSRR